MLYRLFKNKSRIESGFKSTPASAWISLHTVLWRVLSLPFESNICLLFNALKSTVTNNIWASNFLIKSMLKNDQTLINQMLYWETNAWRLARVDAHAHAYTGTTTSESTSDKRRRSRVLFVISGSDNKSARVCNFQYKNLSKPNNC